MRLLITILLVTLTLSASAQKSMFVRVYDLSGNKIHKGKVVAVTETSLQLKTADNEVTIPASSIGMIKTKRSPGHNVAWGAALGGVTVGILGAASANENDWFNTAGGEGFAAGFLLGTLPGAIVGGITALLNKSVTYDIRGDLNNWKVFQTAMNDVNRVSP